MKKRMRRFGEGGSTEEEDKAEGLRLSAKDKVGFLERLRMGNIDDPESEAYKRFGAGRARAARPSVAPVAAALARPTPAAEEDELEKYNRGPGIDVPAGPKAPMPAAARPAMPAAARPAMPVAPARPAASTPDPRMLEAAMSRGRRGMASAPSVPSAAAPVSARAEIPGAGPYTAPASTGRMPGETERNIRNALNAVAGVSGAVGAGAGLRGLLGRGEKGAASGSRALATSETPLTFLGRSGARNVTPPERIGMAPKALPGPKETVDTGTKAVGLSKESVNRAAAKKAAEGPQMSKSEKELLESTMRGRASRAEQKAKRPAPKKPETSASGKSKASPRSKTKYDEDTAGTEFRRGGKIKGYASGGSVTRADGCAQRGKTRGMMR